ncbi:MAG: helix-turn-helix transcriptional regulator [Nitrososphaerota archaeon]|nr:helix-turn-helix transcriptional regulator [Nitrososphaerota archaeon]
MESLLNSDSTVLELAKRLKLIEPGVRKHLDYLESIGVVDSTFRQDGVGRPKKIYRVTRTGRSLFPKMYDTMLTNIISELAKSDQENTSGVLYKTLSSIASSLAASFRERNRLFSREDKIKALEQFLNELGFSSSVTIEKNGEVSILRTDCALYNVALSNYKRVCLDFDSQLVEKCLGERSIVRLETCMALGNAKCQHFVKL